MTYRVLSNLADVLRAGGCPNVIEYSGWQSRGRPSSTGCFDPQGILCHHTASPDSWSDQDDINCILSGNSSAPGPISQLYQSRFAPYPIYVLAAGRANHGGKGRIPGMSCDDMNCRLLGIEAGQSGSTYWPDGMTSAYAQVVAALCQGYGWTTDDVLCHSVTGPPCGNSKIDPSGPWQREENLPLNNPGGSSWDLNVWRQFVAEHMGQGPGPSPTPPPSGGDDLVLCLISCDPEAYAKFAGDMDAQGVVNTIRYLGPRINKVIGFKPDNKTPVLPGTKVLTRSVASMTDFTLVGPLPKGDKVAWSNANFYQGD